MGNLLRVLNDKGAVPKVEFFVDFESKYPERERERERERKRERFYLLQFHQCSCIHFTVHCMVKQELQQVCVCHSVVYIIDELASKLAVAPQSRVELRSHVKKHCNA